MEWKCTDLTFLLPPPPRNPSQGILSLFLSSLPLSVFLSLILSLSLYLSLSFSLCLSLSLSISFSLSFSLSLSVSLSLSLSLSPSPPICSFHFERELERAPSMSLASKVTFESYAAGSEIFKAGETATKFYIILQGETKVNKFLNWMKRERDLL